MRRRTLLLAAPLALLAALAAALWLALVPRPDPQPLPPDLIALASAEGQALLAGSEGAADHAPLTRHFQPQWLKSYCGVASSVIVLSALGATLDQPGFFTDAAQTVRPRWRTMLTGMTLDALGGLLTAHGARATVAHADGFDLAAFRATVARNLARPGDYLIVNYQREVLGQPPTGHISPLAAYDADTDMALILDTAAYKYPFTWVPLDRLYSAMRTVDGESQTYRGYVEVTGLEP